MPRSKVSETRLWQWLSASRKRWRAGLHVTRVENAAGNGHPDVEGCFKGTGFWIELKTSARPAKDSTAIAARFEPEQLPWLRRRCKAGGHAYVLIQVGSGADARRYLIPGTVADMLEDGVEENLLSQASACGGTASAAEIVRVAAMGR